MKVDSPGRFAGANFWQNASLIPSAQEQNANNLRQNGRCEPEVVPGYPDRILPVDAEAEKELKKRTLTNLYNARPQWLANAHAALDAAVADAYGWGDDWRAGPKEQGLSDDEILARLFHLNQDRAAAQLAK